MDKVGRSVRTMGCRMSLRGLASLLLASSFLLLAACGSDNTTADSGPGDSGTADAGTDGGTAPVDSGVDGGQDAGPPCTTGCAWVELALGYGHSCARRENGQVRCWGRGQDGEIGDDRERHVPTCPVEGGADVDCASRPQTVALAVPATSIDARGGFSTCALAGTGDVWCWGGEGFDIGGEPAAYRYAPERFLDLTMIQSVSDSWHTICFLESDGTPLCAGSNGSGQVGSGAFLEALAPVAVKMYDPANPEVGLPLENVLELHTASFFPSFSCARTADTVYCWGSDEAGQLGTGDTVHQGCMSGMTAYSCSKFAVPIPTGDLDATQVAELALGSMHACALMTDGSVRCWGENRAGQLGLGDEVQRTVPTAIAGLTGVTQIAAGNSHTCALLNDGTVHCWGINHQGQVGDGVMVHGNCSIGTLTLDCATAPAQVSGITDAVFIAAGQDHTCAIREGGLEVWCWGANETLQLGDGPSARPDPAARAPRYTPVMVQGL